MKKTTTNISLFIAITSFILFFLLTGFNPSDSNPVKLFDKELGAFPIIVPNIKYGFALDTFSMVENHIIKENQFFGDVLTHSGVTFNDITLLIENCKNIFNVKQWRVGKSYTLLGKNSNSSPDYLIYDASAYVYYVFDINNKNVSKIHRSVSKIEKSASGKIESSLWNAITDNGMSYNIATKMEDALQWSVDFHHVQKDDEFKLVFVEDQIENRSVGVDKVYAAWYKSGKNEFFALYYDHPEHGGYYDINGRPMDKGFLKSPVKYSRISSGYNLKRFHPVLKRTKPHLGTDYAAPYGTPILAVGDGVVTKASRTRGNGNFVKIKHSKTYQTQYLHMQRFAGGIKSGVHVKQGQVIGYVGSTGLATGPHVCFRFWKNGKQVNHRRLSFPPPAPLPNQLLADFHLKTKRYRDLLDSL